MFSKPTSSQDSEYVLCNVSRVVSLKFSSCIFNLLLRKPLCVTVQFWKKYLLKHQQNVLKFKIDLSRRLIKYGTIFWLDTHQSLLSLCIQLQKGENGTMMGWLLKLVFYFSSGELVAPFSTFSSCACPVWKVQKTT